MIILPFQVKATIALEGLEIICLVFGLGFNAYVDLGSISFLSFKALLDLLIIILIGLNLSSVKAIREML